MLIWSIKTKTELASRPPTPFMLGNVTVKTEGALDATAEEMEIFAGN